MSSDIYIVFSILPYSQLMNIIFNDFCYSSCRTSQHYSELIAESGVHHYFLVPSFNYAYFLAIYISAYSILMAAPGRLIKCLRAVQEELLQLCMYITCRMTNTNLCITCLLIFARLVVLRLE